MYAHQYYNNKILTGAMDEETPWVRANVLVADARWKINRKFTLRGELQYLFTNQDYKDWAYGLVGVVLRPLSPGFGERHVEHRQDRTPLLYVCRYRQL